MGAYEQAGYSLGGVSPTSVGYLDPSDGSAKDIKQMMGHYYNSSYPLNAAMWQQGLLDKRFKSGDQTLWSAVYGENNYQNSRRFFFNLIRRQSNMICGYQRKNRKSTITMPNQANSDPLVDEYNKVLKWSEERDGFHEYFSQAFECSTDVGISLLHLYPDYTLDPISGDLFTDYVSYNNFLIDPYFRKQDLTDCNFVWRRRWVTKEQAKALLPGHAKDIQRMNSNGIKDGRFPLQAELLNLAQSSLFNYDEFHYRSERMAKIIIDPKSGEAVEWEAQEGESDDTLRLILQRQPWLIIKEKKVPTVKLAICLGDRVLYDGENLLRTDLFPMVPLLCYHEPDLPTYSWRIQGIIRNIRDAQFLYNMRKVIELDILQSQVNSGWMYKVDRVVDPKAFRQKGQGYVIPIKAGDEPINASVQRIEAPSIPQSMIELSKALSEDIPRITGVNEELLGGAEDDKAGILSVLRQGAGLTTLQSIFDKADYAQRLYGKLRLQAIRKLFSRGKISSILGHEPSPNFFTSHSLKYSIAVEEGNYSTTQRQMELQQLLHFRNLGIPITDTDILNAAFITNKKIVIDNMQKAAQSQSETQKQQAQMQSAIDQSRIASNYAKAKSDLAREKEIIMEAAERAAKIDDLHASAAHKEIESDLNLVKLAMGLEDIQFNQLKKALDVAQAMKFADANGGASFAMHQPTNGV